MPLTIVLPTPGNYTVTDNGIPGDNTFVIKDASGNVISTFVNPGDTLNFAASVAGVNLTLDFGESLGATNVTVGDLTNAAVTPDNVIVNQLQTAGTVTLVANQAISERGLDAAADIVASSVVLSAGTGVGAGSAIEMQTGTLEAETATGGIALTNFGTLQVGGASDQVNGVEVATSGDIKLTVYGTLALGDNTGLQTVKGGSTSGNITLKAVGFDSDLLANADGDAVTAPNGNMILTAGRDVSFGTVGVDYDNDVRASGSVSVTAGRDFLIDGFSDLASDDFGNSTGGGVTIKTGRNIGLLNAAGNDASVSANGTAGANATLTTGAGGTLTLNATSSAALFSNSGNVSVLADHLLISGSSGITTVVGEVDIKAATTGRGFVLGSASDAAMAVELSDAELDRIFAPTLAIGSQSYGTITTISDISPANVQDLKLSSASTIQIDNALTVLSDLIVRAGDNVILGSLSSITAASISALADWVQGDGGAGGAGVFLGSISASPINLSGGAQADYLRGVEGTDQTVHGNDGRDTIISSGEGHYFGDAGNDTMFAGVTSSGAEVLDGGAGTDTLDTTLYSGDYTINLVTGVTNYVGESFIHFENVTTGGGLDNITGTGTANVIDSGTGNDTVNAAGGDDTINGNDGNDHLMGRTGADTINGGIGDDLIDGGLDKDRMTGGAGNDVFLFRDGETVLPRGSADVINDFAQGQDHIDLSAMDANVNAAGNQVFTFINGNAFTHTAGELHYVQNSGFTFVEGDTDGNGTADFAITLIGTYALAGADFVL
jgi:hypothetical protein